MVPCPFTGLSGRKRRPAVVVSPEDFDEEDLILCAITSRLPEVLSGREVLLDREDVAERPLPKRSIVKVGKLFTMHRSLIASRFGTLKDHKLQEVLGKLRGLFGYPDEHHQSAATEAKAEDRIDERRCWRYSI